MALGVLSAGLDGQRSALDRTRGARCHRHDHRPVAATTLLIVLAVGETDEGALGGAWARLFACGVG